MKCAFIRGQASGHLVGRLCRLLGVSRSSYYARCKRPLSARAKADRQLCAHITKAHAANRATYGTVRIWRYLNQAGVACGKHRVRRLRRSLGLEVKRVNRFGTARQSRHRETIVANLLKQRFAVTRPNRV